MSLTSGLSANRKLSRNGLLGDLPEADFWTAIASVVVVNRQVESLLRHKLYTWSRVRNSHGSSGCLRILQLCGCAVSGPSPHQELPVEDQILRGCTALPNRPDHENRFSSGRMEIRSIPWGIVINSLGAENTGLLPSVRTSTM